MNAFDYTAKQILNIPISEPGRIFSDGKVDVIDKEYKSLLKKWHPDKNSENLATDVTIHLAELKKSALNHIDEGTWIEPGVITLRSNEGITYKIRYISKGKFELGEYYFGNEVLVYIVNNSYKALYDNAIRMISGFKYKNKKMEEEISRFLPTIKKKFSTVDGRHVLVLHKNNDLIRLKDLSEHFNNSIDPKHVAWIMSSLHNLMCYFYVEGITHNEISQESYFVSPKMHSGVLLGGWWYAKRSGELLTNVPKRTYEIMSPKQKDTKKASRILNLQLIRLIGLECFGDVSGIKLIKNKDIPKPFVNWLRLPPQKDAIEDYKKWQEEILVESFGKRRFTELSITPCDIYKKEN